MSIRNDIKSYIRQGETQGQGLGLEIEHFVVDEKGVQIVYKMNYIKEFLYDYT